MAAKSVFCLSRDEAQASRIVDDLKSAGFSNNDISALLSGVGPGPATVLYERPPQPSGTGHAGERHHPAARHRSAGHRIRTAEGDVEHVQDGGGQQHSRDQSSDFIEAPVPPAGPVQARCDTGQRLDYESGKCKDGEA